MDLTALWVKTAFLLAHVTIFELPVVILVTAVAAYILARTLERHNARSREARLARRIAAAYASIFVLLMTARFFVL